MWALAAAGWRRPQKHRRVACGASLLDLAFLLGASSRPPCGLPCMRTWDANHSMHAIRLRLRALRSGFGRHTGTCSRHMHSPAAHPTPTPPSPLPPPPNNRRGRRGDTPRHRAVGGRGAGVPGAHQPAGSDRGAPPGQAVGPGALAVGAGAGEGRASWLRLRVVAISGSSLDAVRTAAHQRKLPGHPTTRSGRLAASAP